MCAVPGLVLGVEITSAIYFYVVQVDDKVVVVMLHGHSVFYCMVCAAFCQPLVLFCFVRVWSAAAIMCFVMFAVSKQLLKEGICYGKF